MKRMVAAALLALAFIGGCATLTDSVNGAAKNVDNVFGGQKKREDWE